MRPAPWLSVVVPVYNGQRYLEAALDSVLCQADDDVELIVSDDGSIDGSRELIDSYAHQGRIIALDGPGVGNWVRNSNQAVARARGQLVTFLHQDDVWLPGRLERLKQAQADLPNGALWISPTCFLDHRGRVIGLWHLPMPAAANRIEASAFISRLLVQNFLGMPAPVFSRERFQAIGGMDESLWYTADWDLWLRLGSEAAIGVDWHVTTAFRLHSESQTMSGAGMAESMRLQMEQVRSRHLWRIADARERDAIDRAGRFSSELNTSLACVLGKQPIRWRPLLTSIARLGFRGADLFARNARFGERLSARVRIAATKSRLS